MRDAGVMQEADRLMTVCNSCRYCEGLCAVFPAMERRRVFTAGDLDYLANLCHGCGACFIDCQFAPPHEFAVNVPLGLARLRADSYGAHAWPTVMSNSFRQNGRNVALIAFLGVAVFLTAFVSDGALRVADDRPGAFYAVMPHGLMATLFGVAFSYAVVALALGARNFARAIGGLGDVDAGALAAATKDSGRLRYLDGGGEACHQGETKFPDRRRLFHHLTMYGFLFCFASTGVATLYHFLLGLEAPYQIYDLPVLLGTLGGLGLVIGPVGLYAERLKTAAILQDEKSAGMDTAFLAMLFLVSVSGLALLALRSTPAMALALAIHLGLAFALFVTAPYGKMVHGLYRYMALIKFAAESRDESE